MKKLCSLALSGILLFSFILFPTLVNASDSDVCGVYGEEDLKSLTPELQLENACAIADARENDATFTAFMKNTAKEMYDFMALTEEERTAIVRESMQSQITDQSASIASTSALPSYYTRLPVPFYKQEKSYWCGPATAQQTIIYLEIKYSSWYRPTQSEIAAAIGTTTAGSSTTNIAKWLATKGYTYYSVPVSSMTYQDIENYVYSALEGYHQPCFGGITVSSNNLGEWHYSTGGHILNISGIYYDGVSYHNDYFEFTDPYITWVKPAMTSGKYEISIAEYKRVMTSFWW